MRFSVSYLIVSLLAAFVAATPIAEPAPPCKDCPHPPPSQDEITVQQCGNGDLQCCNDIQKASSEASQNLLGLLAAVAGVAVDPSTNLGLNSGGATGTKCQKTAACCSGQNYNGFIVLGCNPVNFGI